MGETFANTPGGYLTPHAEEMDAVFGEGKCTYVEYSAELIRRREDTNVQRSTSLDPHSSEHASFLPESSTLRRRPPNIRKTNSSAGRITASTWFSRLFNRAPRRPFIDDDYEAIEREDREFDRLNNPRARREDEEEDDEYEMLERDVLHER